MNTFKIAQAWAPPEPWALTEGTGMLLAGKNTLYLMCRQKTWAAFRARWGVCGWANLFLNLMTWRTTSLPKVSTFFIKKKEKVYWVKCSKSAWARETSSIFTAWIYKQEWLVQRRKGIRANHWTLVLRSLSMLTITQKGFIFTDQEFKAQRG